MEFIIGSVQPATGDPMRVVPVTKSGGSKERRKKKQDRRKNVREGIYVSLSTREERRRPGDRRKAGA